MKIKIGAIRTENSEIDIYKKTKDLFYYKSFLEIDGREMTYEEFRKINCQETAFPAKEVEP